MLIATTFALTAAVLHAVWNLLAKRAADPFLALWGQFACAGLIGLVGLAITGGPGAEAWPYAVLGGVIHIPYLAALAHAYHHGDFSLAYPIARGGGALIAAAGGVLLLGDDLNAVAIAAIVIVAGGLALLSWGAQGKQVWLALFVAATIGAYTVTDSHGARITDVVAYSAAAFACSGTGITIYGLARGRGCQLVDSIPSTWRRYVLTGVVTVLTYGLVLAAVRHAPVGYVAALRESSVVLAAIVGWRFLGEAHGGRRLVASAIVVAGLVLLILAR